MNSVKLIIRDEEATVREVDTSKNIWEPVKANQERVSSNKLGKLERGFLKQENQ